MLVDQQLGKAAGVRYEAERSRASFVGGFSGNIPLEVAVLPVTLLRSSILAHSLI